MNGTLYFYSSSSQINKIILFQVSRQISLAWYCHVLLSFSFRVIYYNLVFVIIILILTEYASNVLELIHTRIFAHRFNPLQTQKYESTKAGVRRGSKEDKRSPYECFQKRILALASLEGELRGFKWLIMVINEASSINEILNDYSQKLGYLSGQ